MIGANADLLIYIGGLIALGSISACFIFVDYYQRKNKTKRKQNR